MLYFLSVWVLMLLLDWILLFPSVVVGHNRMTKNTWANTVREPQIQFKCARESDNTAAP